jgi:flagellar biogenesis protein FliO
MKVVARVGLSPKHAMYMVQVGHRLLVVGTGPQGAPSLITELDEAECPVFVTPTPAAQAGKVVAS